MNMGPWGRASIIFAAWLSLESWATADSIEAPVHPMHPRTFVKSARLWAHRMNPSRSPAVTAALVSSTLLLAAHDQEAFERTQAFSQRIGLIGPEGQGDESQCLLCQGGARVEVPASLNAAFAFYGDGTLPVVLSLGYLGLGALRGDTELTETGAALARALVLAGVVVVAIKMTTGRESPAAATAAGGRWHGFPGVRTYMANQPKYYAYPSGHTTTAIAWTTVMVGRYSKQRWIAPLGYGMSALTMLAMVNRKAHWWSDYPLAIVLGYTLGTAAVEAGESTPSSADESSTTHGTGWRWQGVAVSGTGQIGSAWTF